MPHTKFKSPFEVLMSIASKENFENACKLAGLDKGEIVEILLAKELNKGLVLTEGHEAKMRRLKADTLRDYKNDGLLPLFYGEPNSKPLAAGKG